MRKTVITFGIATLAIIGMQSCKEGAKESKETVEAKEEAQASTDAETFAVNTTDSKINWMGKTMVGKHNGFILLKSGEITIKEGKLESGNFVADMNSLKSVDSEDPAVGEKLDGHLKNEDFFDVTKFPESKFTVTSVKPLEGEFNSELEGNLEIKGVSKNLSVKANVKVEGTKVTLTTEKFTINRQDFGITYSNGNPKDKVIDDLFDMEVVITADKK